MPSILKLLLAFALLGLFSASVSAETKPYVNDEAAADAARYEDYLKKAYKADGKPVATHRKQGDRLLAAGDLRGAATSYISAVLASRTDARSWLGLATALLATPPANDDERYNLPVNATGAAYAAYANASKPETRAEALATLAGALKQRSYWRSAINAYKASLELTEVATVRTAYEALVAEQGFRILDYTVDSDAASPRLCIQFSELLARTQGDFSSYVSIDGKDPASVTVNDSQLCAEGLTHGQRYQVQLRAGLPSDLAGESLLKTADLSVYVRDRSPSVRFTGRNYVLPRTGQQGIPLVTVNTDRVKIAIYRIGDRGLSRAVIDGEIESQISGDQVETLKTQRGTEIWSGELPVKLTINEEVTTAFPISDTVETLKPGVYVMIAEPQESKTEYWSQRATQWFVVSDLGLTAFTGDDGVNAFVRSLETAAPMAGATVKLVARDNDILATATSDASGHVHFEAGLARGDGGAAPAILMAESATGDYAFLDLTTGAFDLTDRGVAGRTAPGPLDGFIFTERGVYRPGEPVYVTVLLRDRAGAAATGIPLTMKITRPDGVEHLSASMPDQAAGGRTSVVNLSAGAMTGTWRARVYSDPESDPVAETSFLVEDYVPERLDLTLEPAETVLVPGQPGLLRASGRYLYGPPAANLAVEGDVTVRAATTGLAGFEGYQFGLSDESVAPVRSELSGLPSTDADGKAALPIALPQLPRTSRLLEARVLVRLREPSGRTIERNVTLPIGLAGSAIGIKPLFSGSLGQGELATFDIVQLDQAGKPRPVKGLKWQLLRIEQQYQWYGRNGSWNYEPITYTSRIADGTIDQDGTGPARLTMPVEWGSYRLEVSSVDASGPASSAAFYAGWYGGQSADSPEALEVSLDKASYRPGDTAKLRITPNGGGKAMIAVMREGLLSTREVDVPDAGATVDIPVDATMTPGAYVTATLYRPMDIVGKRMPSRSIGVIWLKTETADKSLAVSLGVPEKVSSGATLEAPVTLAGLAAGEEAYVTVAAVDVGILNLTSYKAPAPEDWYFGQRRLGTEIRDLYGRLIDGMRAERGSPRSGGDEMALEAVGSPPNATVVALFSGILKVDATGKVTASLALPEFNGSVKVMAVAWSAGKLGHAEKEVIVRDPVALLVSGPRFMIMGDEARLVFDMHNVEGQAGDYLLSITATDETGNSRSVLDKQVRLGAGERRLESIAVKAETVGETTYQVRLKGPGGVDVARAFAFDAHAPANDIRRTTVQKLAKGGKITVSKDVLGDLIADRSTVTISVGTTSGLDVPGLLAALDRYPYGCAEQITSRALPLLYLNTIADAVGVTGEEKAKERVAEAIDRLLEMQDSTGGFGLWAPGEADMWLSAYVTDFLTRAKELGHKVPARQFTEALDRLQNSVAYASDFESGGEEIAYALYVLARNSRAPIGDLRYYVDTRLDRFATPLAKAHIGAALAMYGDKERAERAFAAAVSDFKSDMELTGRFDYGSELRDGAAVLTLIAETGAAKAASGEVAGFVAQSRLGRGYTSTQEQAWMLLAAKALMDEGKTVALNVNGQRQEGSVMRKLTAAELAAGNFVVENVSDVNVDAVVTVSGESTTVEPATSSGFSIERQFYALDGTLVDPLAKGAKPLVQNERLVVVLQASETEAQGGRFLIVDRLPAGLEIENPRLVESGSTTGFGWLPQTTVPEHTEFRDDRFVAAFDARSGEGAPQTLTVAYVVRAVTPGTYVAPAATVEDMYLPERYARSASGALVVAPGN
ncbi:MAG: alpha-2-macroglobulin [Hyphomicrobiaceae bacterium]